MRWDGISSAILLGILIASTFVLVILNNSGLNTVARLTVTTYSTQKPGYRVVTESTVDDNVEDKSGLNVNNGIDSYDADSDKHHDTDSQKDHGADPETHIEPDSRKYNGLNLASEVKPGLVDGKSNVVNVTPSMNVTSVVNSTDLTTPSVDQVAKQKAEEERKHENEEKLSILDPVAMQFHNLSESVTSNETNKVPIIEEEATQAEEKKDGLAIFFILFVIVLATLLVHIIIVTEFHYMPESLAIVLLGAVIGFLLSYSKWDWREVETFNPNFFFLVLLPPIIFESGYNLNKGNFFSNIIPILTFAIIGTALSAFVMGFGVWFLGYAGIIYKLTAVESFAFGSMISAVDPVITLAIFQALKVDAQLYMLAFGESMLNDAVAIVLASTALEMNSPHVIDLSSADMVNFAFTRFMAMFFVSALLGAGVGFISALLFKHVHLRRTPSLELALLIVFAYLPYGMAEALSLSGIMAILFCAITMSQYTHFNISPITQLTMQQTFRTLSFVAETSTFAYLGLALFTIKLVFQPIFLVWSVILLFVSRAASIFPLSYIVNRCSNRRISMKNQMIMWFSGMRGAVAFALALHMQIDDPETKRMILTSTLFIVLFTVVFMGGSALPFIKFLNKFYPEEAQKSLKKKSRKQRTEKRQKKMNKVVLSKTNEMAMMDQSEFTTEGDESDGYRSDANPENFFTRLNERLVKPLFVRRVTYQERQENRARFQHLASELMKRPNRPSQTSSDEEEYYLPTKSSRRPLIPM
ncbi:unnamed protein product [Bursaphelenchus okinawaensis]|uniref:Sodium/hydrogen exchanger n=1 Tax=Bursaphelenchus okinawaensis TaxID=465554 RepID=A0A811JSB7_9BILA|nr:unnamed protein product [Bursaphelenchus okinawaensis]CAG9080264.1 unnamed protein product [Bursaphelenchus okinawaensis]